MGVFWFRSPLSAVLTILGGLLAALVACFLILAAAASLKSTQVREGWAQSFGTYDQILERYPSTEANASALRLEELSARMGLGLATRGYADRAEPTKEAAGRFRSIKIPLNRYLGGHVERSHRQIDAPPDDVASYLAAHREDLDEIHRHLDEAEVPQWERQLEKITAAPIPNLLGHIDLQKILIADALACAQREDRERALAGFRASWRLNHALRDEPMLIVQQIGVNGAHLLTGALRQVEGLPYVWRERLFEHDFRGAVVDSLRFEGWHWTQINEPAQMTDVQSVGKSMLTGVIKPYFRYCLADMSDKYRVRIDNLDGVSGICDYDLSPWKADLDVPVSGWNVIGHLMQPYVDGTLRRLARFELNRELTTKLLELEEARRTKGGWPESIAGIEESAACPREHWLYEVSPEGAMTLALDREITWPDVKGTRLPTSFTIR